MKVVIFFLIFCFSVNAWTADREEAGKKREVEAIVETDEMIQKQVDKTKKRLQEHIFTANLGVNMTQIEKFDNSEFGLMLGGKYSYYFSPKVGAFIGLDFIQRNASEEFELFGETLHAKLNFIDIPFGLAFRYNMLGIDGVTFLGLYYTLLQGGELKTRFASLDLDGEDHLGFLLHSELYFKVNESFTLGFFAGLKFGFGNAITKVDNYGQKIDFITETETQDITFGLVTKF